MNRLADVMGALKFRFRAAFGRTFGMVYSDKVARANANFLCNSKSHKFVRIRRIRTRVFKGRADGLPPGQRMFPRTNRTRKVMYAIFHKSLPLVYVGRTTYYASSFGIRLFFSKLSARCTDGGTRTVLVHVTLVSYQRVFLRKQSAAAPAMYG